MSAKEEVREERSVMEYFTILFLILVATAKLLNSK